MYIDSHAHLTSDELFPLVDEILSRAKLQKIEAIVNICTDTTSLERAASLKNKVPRLYHTAATTPHDVEKEGDLFFPYVEQAAKKGDIVALGETGLDYYYERAGREKQKEFLLRYFSLARKTGLPLVFHCREAFADLFSLADGHIPSHLGLLHCFTGTLEEAKGVLDRGWYLSLSGIVTFKKSQQLQEVAKYVPLDRLLIETDSPYLAPQSKRGKQNEPSFLPEVAEMIAAVKNVSLDEVAFATSTNAKSFFKMDISK